MVLPIHDRIRNTAAVRRGNPHGITTNQIAKVLTENGWDVLLGKTNIIWRVPTWRGYQNKVSVATTMTATKGESKIIREGRTSMCSLCKRVMFHIYTKSLRMTFHQIGDAI